MTSQPACASYQRHWASIPVGPHKLSLATSCGWQAGSPLALNDSIAVQALPSCQEARGTSSGSRTPADVPMPLWGRQLILSVNPSRLFCMVAAEHLQLQLVLMRPT